MPGRGERLSHAGGDRTWLLAVDFDEASWQADVSAFQETCAMLNIVPAVERSRSGNGAHVWFFFSEPVSASGARKLGSGLLTQTMARRDEMVSDLIYVDKSGSSQGALNAIKRLAAFRDLEFYKKQAMRLRVYNTSRIFDCSWENEDFLGIPRGCMDALTELLDTYSVP